ncbi:LacI family DNA-binding transcriptional regulator [uncultured Litoreibacter sp.]|uniref:LacI family DNA-binding transcriptional regulator n=1 Tax=uncultured Litoreibacter sp. TaxID=1392394 RepID=UPI00260342AD|nr:LacI family DNA-binding transcriptional regulator [uncultured Litoreibacter sp.]
MQRSSVTMKNVATAAGVSVMTVSRAFKADKSVNEETRKRIVQLADELGYVFDTTAANLRTQKTNFVAAIIPSINNANFADTVDALSDRLEAAGMQVLLGYSDYNIEKEEILIEQLLRRKPDAIVVTGGQHSPRARKLLKNANIPVVETWDLPQDPIEHVVGFSNADTTRGLVDHLVERGKSRIAFIGGDSNDDTRGADRRRGFIRAMASHGLDSSRLISAGPTPISMREGADAMARLLDTLPDTQAVVCVSDLSAFGALTECQRRGVAVPSDICIAGFGAYEIAAVSHPTLTTINPQPREIGTKTAELILDQLAASEAEAVGASVQEIEWSLRVAGST